jgi:hypothetical protein
VVGYSAFRLFFKNKEDDEESHMYVQVEECRVFHETMAGGAFLIRAGDRLDICEKLLQGGPISVVELAQKTGWLGYGQNDGSKNSYSKRRPPKSTRSTMETSSSYARNTSCFCEDPRWSDDRKPECFISCPPWSRGRMRWCKR